MVMPRQVSIGTHLCKQVILDPQELGKSAQRLGPTFGIVLKGGMSVQRLSQEAMQPSKEGIHVNVFDVDLAFLGWGIGVNAAHPIEVVDEGGIVISGNEFDEVFRQEVFPELDLVRIQGKGLETRGKSALEALVALQKDSFCDVEGE